MTKNWYLVPIGRRIRSQSLLSPFFLPLSFLFSNATLYNLETRSFLLLLPLRPVYTREMLITDQHVTAFTLNVPSAFCFSETVASSEGRGVKTFGQLFIRSLDFDTFGSDPLSVATVSWWFTTGFGWNKFNLKQNLILEAILSLFGLPIERFKHEFNFDFKFDSNLNGEFSNLDVILISNPNHRTSKFKFSSNVYQKFPNSNSTQILTVKFKSSRFHRLFRMLTSVTVFFSIEFSLFPPHGRVN